MNRKEYNGWTNYETWAVALWIDNEEPSYRERCERAESAVEREDDAGDFAHELKDWIEEAVPDLGATLWADLLQGALSEVNWYEIAEVWIGEAKEALERA